MSADMLQRLEMVIHSGRKAGVYVIMAWNMTAEFENKSDQSSNFDPRSILKTMMVVFPVSQGGGRRYNFKNSGHDELFNRYMFEYDNSLITAQDISSWCGFLNEKVEVAKKLLKPKVWKQDFAGLQKRPYEPIMSDFSVTIGKDVSDAHVASLRFNTVDYIHAFILGQSGSGKSVLLNNIITSVILKYSPEDLMLYLMDFKGVEFTRYRGVKHAKAILVDNSDQQMTLEVLR